MGPKQAAMEECYLSGKSMALVRAAVITPPRAFFPPPRPNDLITVPVHTACNRAPSRDEGAFRAHVAAIRESSDE